MTESEPGLTVVLPALNEEAMIGPTVTGLLPILDEHLQHFELILFNDGSTDKTGEVMEELARGDSRIRVMHNPTPRNIAWMMVEGARVATQPYIIMIPGDNAYNPKGFIPMLRALGSHPILFSYRTNLREGRTYFRYLLSQAFTAVMKGVFRLTMRDCHSCNIYPVDRLRALRLVGMGHGIQVEIITKLTRHGATFAEFPAILHKPSESGASRSLTRETLFDVLTVLAHLMADPSCKKCLGWPTTRQPDPSEAPTKRQETH